MTANRLRQRASVLERLQFAVMLRLLVGGTFVFSGATKLLSHSQFVDTVDSYHILPHSLATAYGVTLPWVELVIGVYLLFAILIRSSAVAVVLMGISFMVANVSAIVRGDEHCGSCFGEAITFPAWQSLVVDVLIMITALYLVVVGGGKGMLGFDSWFANRECAGTSESDK
jgi:uncharacterized membrane protein YphA (DoxX/SURF4 family)